MAEQKNVQQIHSTVVGDKVLPHNFAKNNHEFKKISACINYHSALIHLLLCDQPLSLKEILNELGTSKQNTLRSLKQLIKYNLVIRVNFESHVLYVLNGEYSPLILSFLVPWSVT